MPTVANERSAPIPYNPEILKWAREWRARTYEEAAASASVTPSQIEAWEAGNGAPTLKQARALALEYGRPFLEFFLREKPNLKHTSLVPDFRLHSGARRPKEERDLTDIQEWAENQRLNALDLFAVVGEDPPAFPSRLSATTRDDPEALADIARETMDFPIEKQLTLKQKERAQLVKIVRSKIERIGALVLKDGSLAKFGARGLCLYFAPLPIIVFGNEAPSAQAFTLAHELAHIILMESALSGPPPSQEATSREASIERWCNEFAAAFLIPMPALNQKWERPATPWKSIDLTRLRELADTFGASSHAMLIRLVRLGYVDPSFYWRVMRPRFIEDEASYQSPPMRPKYYGSRYRSARGDMYTGLVLEAWSTGRITNHNAAEFMGIKKISRTLKTFEKTSGAR